MKGKGAWIIGFIGIFIGNILFGSATAILYIYDDYTTFEQEILIIIKWVGVVFLILGLFLMLLREYQDRYTYKHVQDITPIVKRGGVIKCEKCDLMVSSDVKSCPRCGNRITSNNKEQRFCSMCGNRVDLKEIYCSKCGQKIQK